MAPRGRGRGRGGARGAGGGRGTGSRGAGRGGRGVGIRGGGRGGRRVTARRGRSSATSGCSEATTVAFVSSKAFIIRRLHMQLMLFRMRHRLTSTVQLMPLDCLLMQQCRSMHI